MPNVEITKMIEILRKIVLILAGKWNITIWYYNLV
jgi:hypothetical protein